MISVFSPAAGVGQIRRRRRAMETVTEARVSTNQVSAVQLESVTGWTFRDRIMHVWHRLCAEVQEINYVGRRFVELQLRLPR
jgi:hypothetical protein